MIHVNIKRALINSIIQYMVMLVFSMITIFAIVPAALGEMAIAHEGKALVNIVKAADLIPSEITAVKELSDYLSKITGAAFQVIEEKEIEADSHAIYVGPTIFAQKHGIDIKKLGEEESILSTVEGNLILTGGRPRGTLYAVYELLEKELGCRWYTPWYEKVPKQADLKIKPLQEQIKPHFMVRDGGSDFWRDDQTFFDKETFKRFDEQYKWYIVRNRINGGFYGRTLAEDVGGYVRKAGRESSHSFFAYVPAQRYFRDHPEYFSERNGKRVRSTAHDGNHICLTNPSVLDIVIAGVKEDIRTNPDGKYISVSVNDGGCETICDCKNCRAAAGKEGESGLLLWFVNQVADAIKDEYPDKYIVTLAYIATKDPPKRIVARDNVIVWITKGTYSCKVYLPKGIESSELDSIRQWTKYAKHIWIWDYGTSSWWMQHYLKPMTWKMTQQFKLAKELDVIDGIFMDHHNMTYEEPPNQFYELDCWIYAHLCREPGMDLDMLIDDFLSGYFGQAAPHLRKYLNLVRDNLPKYPYQMFDYTFISNAQAYFDKAEESVKDDPERLDRVRTYRISLDTSTLAYRNSIVNSYLRSGGVLDNYPFKINKVRDRALSYIENSQYPVYQTKKLSGYFTANQEEWITTYASVREVARQYVQDVSQGAEYSPIPKQFREMDTQNVIDITAPLLSGGEKDLVSDPEAAIGLAVVRKGDNRLPMGHGIYNLITPPDQKLQVSEKPVEAADIPDKGYHWFKGPRFTMWEWTFIYFPSDWTIQEHFWPLFDPKNPNQQWEYYFSVKFTGPAYPHGAPDKPNAMFLDRVILVKVTGP